MPISKELLMEAVVSDDFSPDTLSLNAEAVESLLQRAHKEIERAIRSSDALAPQVTLVYQGILGRLLRLQKIILAEESILNSGVSDDELFPIPGGRGGHERIRFAPVQELLVEKQMGRMRLRMLLSLSMEFDETFDPKNKEHFSRSPNRTHYSNLHLIRLPLGISLVASSINRRSTIVFRTQDLEDITALSRSQIREQAILSGGLLHHIERRKMTDNEWLDCVLDAMIQVLEKVGNGENFEVKEVPEIDWGDSDHLRKLICDPRFLSGEDGKGVNIHLVSEFQSSDGLWKRTGTQVGTGVWGNPNAGRTEAKELLQRLSEDTSDPIWESAAERLIFDPQNDDHLRAILSREKLEEMMKKSRVKRREVLECSERGWKISPRSIAKSLFEKQDLGREELGKLSIRLY